MTFLPQQKNGKTLRATSWLVMVGFVFQLGAASCGCFEHNGWVQLFQSVAAQQNKMDTESVAATKPQHSHGKRSHRHVAVSKDADAGAPSEFVQDQHDCKPSAISNAVLAQQVQLPSNVMTACLFDSHSDLQNRCGGRFGQFADTASLALFRDGPARFVTQAFLL